MNKSKDDNNNEDDNDENKQPSKCKINLLIGLCILVMAICIGASVFVTRFCLNSNTNDPHCLSVKILKQANQQQNRQKNESLPGRNTKNFDYTSFFNQPVPYIFKKAAVASDMHQCSIVGTDILKMGGNAIDSGIATIFCLGTMNLHSSGIGGGGALLFFDPTTLTNDRSIFGGVTFYDFRETAGSLTNLSQYLNKNNASRKGGLSIAVPGEVAGLYKAWTKHGVLPWSLLVEPAYKIALNGFKLHQRLYDAAKSMFHIINKDIGLRNLLIKDDDILPLGSLIINLPLAETYKSISTNPLGLYDGELSKKIMEDLNDISSNILPYDLKNYQVKIKDPVLIEINDMILYSAPLPFGGACVLNIINVLNAIYKNNTASCENMSLFIHRLVESFKFAFSDRTKMSDPDFTSLPKLKELLENMLNKSKIHERISKIDDNQTHSVKYYEPLFDITNDHGTTHVSIIDENGKAVSLTSSINEWFGSVYRSERTGIVYNNQIDDFSIPNQFNGFGLLASPLNRPEPHKRPQSSISPTIIVSKIPNSNQRKVKLVIGASGGSRIITSTASIIAYNIFCKDDIKNSISKPRVHHQLSPNEVVIERGVPINYSIIQELKNKGHRIEMTYRHEFSAVQGVETEINNKEYHLKAWSDKRKYGQADGY